MTPGLQLGQCVHKCSDSGDSLLTSSSSLNGPIRKKKKLSKVWKWRLGAVFQGSAGYCLVELYRIFRCYTNVHLIDFLLTRLFYNSVRQKVTCNKLQKCKHFLSIEKQISFSLIDIQSAFALKKRESQTLLFHCPRSTLIQEPLATCGR